MAQNSWHVGLDSLEVEDVDEEEHVVHAVDEEPFGGCAPGPGWELGLSCTYAGMPVEGRELRCVCGHRCEGFGCVWSGSGRGN